MDSRFSVDAAVKKAGDKELPPPRLMIIGPPGSGKSTFGASAPNAIFVKTEQGCEGLNVPALPVGGVCRSWQELIDSLLAVRDSAERWDWCVLDSVTGAQSLCRDKVCQEVYNGVWVNKDRVQGYNSWNNGQKESQLEFEKLTCLLDEIRSKGVGIIMLGHEGVHKATSTTDQDYMKTGGKMETLSWDTLVQWCDQVGWICRDTASTTYDGERKAKIRMLNSERWLVFDGGPAVDAKCRAGYDMPARILFGWEEYQARLMENSVEVLIKQCVDLLSEADSTTQKAILKRYDVADLKAASKKINGLPTPTLQAMANWLLSRQKPAAGQEK